MESFHGLALKGGNPTVANCSSCHGVHDILPSSDPMSSVNPRELPQTCGRCHPGIGTRLAAEFFKIHAPKGPREDKPWVVNLVSIAYIALIVATIGGMWLFVALDYWRKSRAHVRAVKADPRAEERLTPSMRWQHLILTVLFVALAYTGFVHAFPDAFFSWPFRAMPNGNALRSSLHRISGWAFVVFFTAHAAALILGRAGRAHARALWFSRDDARDFTSRAAPQPGTAPGRAAAPPLELRREGRVPGARVGIGGDDHHRHHAHLQRGDAAPLGRRSGATWPRSFTTTRPCSPRWPSSCGTPYWVVFDPAEYPMNPSWLIGTRASQHAHAPDPAQAAARRMSRSRRRRLLSSLTSILRKRTFPWSPWSISGPAPLPARAVMCLSFRRLRRATQRRRGRAVNV